MASDDAAIRALLPIWCPLADLPKLARAAAGGGLRSDLDAGKRAYLLAEWLRWSLDEETADRRWQYLAAPPGDKPIGRDRYVEELLGSLAKGGANHALASQIKKLMEPWDSYRKHFFAWFLRRFDFRAAGRIYSPRFLTPWTGWLLAILATLAEALCVRRFGLAPTPAVAVFAAVAAARRQSARYLRTQSELT